LLLASSLSRGGGGRGLRSQRDGHGKGSRQDADDSYESLQYASQHAPNARCAKV
jgi:hypothetical protein